MTSRGRLWVIVVNCCAVGIGGLPSNCTAAQPHLDASVAKHDKDHGHSLDLAEVRRAASIHFDVLNPDGDATLETVEVRGILGPQMFAAADQDHDGTLSKAEYLALVERLFKKADIQHYGKLYASDLRSKAGVALSKLID